jgi:CHAT domain-containing protein
MNLPTGARVVASVLLGGLAAVGPTPTALGEETTRLAPGQAVDREMEAGETHRYSIELRAGEYVEVLVEQRGADVIQTLTAPDGSVVAEIDWPSQFIGPDPLAAVAAQTGVYVLSLKADAVLSPPRGAYQVRLLAVREPSPQDRLRVQAMQAGGAETKRAFRSDRRAALAQFRQALQAWQELGDRRMQMWTELVVGVLLAQGIDDYVSAVAHYRNVLATALDLGDEWAEARVRYNLAQALRRIGGLEEANEHYERALALQRVADRPDPIARILTAMGFAAAWAGEPQRALDLQFEALGIFQALGNTRSVAVTRNDIANTYLLLGDWELALEQTRLAVPAFDREPPMRASTLTRMATAHFQLGDDAGAREAYTEAAAIFRAAGNRALEADSQVGLGDVEQRAGDLRAARERLVRALENYRSAAYALGEGLALCRLAEIDRRLAEPVAARAALLAALALAPRAGPQLSGCAEAGLARLARDAGDLPRALGHAETALTLADSIRARIGTNRARATALASQQALYELLIDILMERHATDRAGGHAAAAFEMSERSRARSLLELLAEGDVEVRRGVDPELLATERSLRRAINARAEEQAQALGAPGRAEQAAILGRELDALLARLAETESLIRRGSPQYAALTQPQPLTLAEVRARVLDPDTQLLQYALGEARSYLWVVSGAHLHSATLPPRAEIERAARRVHELAAQAPAAAPGAGKSALLDAALRELSRLLLAPAAGALTAKRLRVVTPGALQHVPFAALPLDEGAASLASRFELVSAPSASVIATLRGDSRGRGRGAGAVAVFADPVFEASDPRLAAARPAAPATAPATQAMRGAAPDPLARAVAGVRGNREGGLGRLPFSRREAAAIAALAPTAQTLTALGFDATRAAATSPRVGDYRIVHFATHGVLHTQRPALSGLVLSLVDRTGRPQDGFLRLHDVYNLKLAADLVVLSGCQTALGKDLSGEGLVGLTRGFLYAGADRVVASLWQVDDESTAELMRRFYRGMLRDGRRPPDALRTAQLEMSRHPRWSAPFYWAGFVLQGEWR